MGHFIGEPQDYSLFELPRGPAKTQVLPLQDVWVDPGWELRSHMPQRGSQKKKDYGHLSFRLALGKQLRISV